ncbi:MULTISPECIES: hypothetical protein [unclassified Mycolicibacterium]|uniref:hypothetical protein n=1 Tax=unclassified Mycolicibacterium TaxID=2636767 RepID=UPI002ED95299
MTTRRISAPYLAYVLLLLAFASLGTLVAASAVGSGLAVVASVALAACLTGTVAGFRAGARDLNRAGMTDAPDSAVSMFSKPLHTDEIDRYIETYRSGRDNITLRSGNGLTVVAGGGRSAEHDGERVAVLGGSETSHRLSA